MPEITFIVDDLQGAILVEDNQDVRRDAIEHLHWSFGESREIGCARPLEIIKPIAHSSHTAPGQVRPGISSMGLPLPTTRTVKLG